MVTTLGKESQGETTPTCPKTPVPVSGAISQWKMAEMFFVLFG